MKADGRGEFTSGWRSVPECAKWVGMLLYLQIFLVYVWMIVTSAVSMARCLIFWGRSDNDHFFGRLYHWGVSRILGYRVEVEGAEHLTSQQPCVYTVNHQDSLDLAVCGAYCPKNFVVIGKQELIYIPFFGLVFVAAGNIVIKRQKHRHAMAGLASAAEIIRKRKVSVFIFPEGTRNKTEAPMLPFKKGGFLLAVQAQVPVVPVVISSLKGAIDWKTKTFRPRVIRVKVLPSVPTQGLQEQDIASLAESTREKMLEAFRSLVTLTR